MTLPASNSDHEPVSSARVLVSLMVPLFMALVAISVINVALPVIGTSLGADSTGLQWVVSGYALSFGLLLVPSGRLGDATGRKRLFLGGISVFVVGAVVAGFAQNIEMLNAARILQGVGSGMLNPQAVGLIQKYFRGQARARAFATMATTVSVATASGPLVGGLLIQAFGDDLGWRVMFLVNVPLGILAVFLARAWLPDDRMFATGEAHQQSDDESTVAADDPPAGPAPGPPAASGRRRRTRLDLDPIGILLLGAAVLAVMLPFLGRDAPAVQWILVPVGVALFGVFAWWERRYARVGRPPLVNPAIFRDVGFRNGMIIVSIYFVGGTSLWIVMPLYLQFHLGYAPIDSALISLPASICAAISAQVAGRFVLRLGRRLVITGFSLTITALIAFMVLAEFVESGALPYLVFMVPAFFVGTAQGMTIAPNQTLTLKAVDPAYGGVAGSIISLGQRMGTAVGTAIVPGVMFGIAESQDDWVLAFRVALGIIVVLSMGALAFSIVDRRREKRA